MGGRTCDVRCSDCSTSCYSNYLKEGDLQGGEKHRAKYLYFLGEEDDVKSLSGNRPWRVTV